MSWSVRFTKPAQKDARKLATDRVQITRSPSGDLVIHPCPTSAWV